MSAQNLPTSEEIETQYDNDKCRINLRDGPEQYGSCRHPRPIYHRASEETCITGLQEMQTSKAAGMPPSDIDAATDEYDR